ncbi:hypothetical protein HYALB_00007519 [Hymenoscyphus albidus]|uniref:COP9 signalosome complex subunit 3 N-terminal helical repeats domain-containing protein n=1 Tax=Hymenoscyphus albidus TaxID=595503 RepID=A0A9N9QCD8_9HELO|nr:hypothetical protein HYALB_00007519 [Hymenoscyphus albidus]
MDEILPKLLAFPPHPSPLTPLSDAAYEEGIKSQIATVKSLSEAKLIQKTSSDENALDIINPSLNAVSFAFVLLANINTIMKGNDKQMDIETLWNHITTFLSNFDGRQIRYLGHELSNIIDAAVAIARRHNQIALVIPHIRDALLGLDPSGTVLTSKHIQLLKLVMETQSYAAVVPIIEKTILYIPGASEQPKPKHISSTVLSPPSYVTPESGITAKKLKVPEVLEYLFLCGTIYVGLRDWANAKRCFEVAVAYPARETSCSKIMAEAYKRWLLVSVLLDGKVPLLPRATSSGAAKMYHVVAKPYETLAQLFEHGSAFRLKQEADAGNSVWQADANFYLVLTVLAGHQQFQIKHLANVYSKISIADIHAQTMSAETGTRLPHVQAVETMVQMMIANGSLNATLSYPPNQSPVVAFSQEGPVLTEQQMKGALALASSQIKELILETKTTDRLMTYEKEYVKYIQKMKKNSKNLDQGIAGNDLDWNGVEDEDLMGGF